MSGYIIRIHQFSDGPTGHTNVEFIDSGRSIGVYGANTAGFNGLGFKGGVFEESSSNQSRININPSSHRTSDIVVSESAFNNALVHSQVQASMTSNGTGNYDILCGNCVDFADSVLTAAGMARFSIDSHLSDGSLLDIYANVSKYLCINSYDLLMESQFQWAPPSYVYQYLENKYGYSPFWTNEWFSMFHDLEEDIGNSRHTDDLIWLESDYNQFGSPIAIDLDKNGIQTISLSESQAIFDITGDGIKEKVAWLNKYDGFLFMDENANFIVDGVQELFGGKHRGDGYRKLAKLDTNNDMLINKDDMSYFALRIWIDGNTDGQSNINEIHTLADLKIDFIGTKFTTVDIRDNGNLIGEISLVGINESTTNMVDIYFKYEAP